MPVHFRYIVSVVFAFFVVFGSEAQQGFYVPVAGKIFFTGDSATIFNNVLNAGQLGIGKQAVVNFKGIDWHNDPSAKITDESNQGNGSAGQGGLLRFLVPDESLSSGTIQQQSLSGGYNAASRSGPAFANVQINNKWGVRLDYSSARIRLMLSLKEGNIFTNGNTLSVGENNPGVITGYNSRNFIVTSGGGVLLREKLNRSSGKIDFPVGSNANDYAPASIFLNHDLPDDFYVGAREGAWSNAVSGVDIKNIAVNNTWQIGKIFRPGSDQVEITLQHRLEAEGPDFNRYRNLSYISNFTSAGWDTGGIKMMPVSPGTITTSLPLLSSAVNSRVFDQGIAAQSFYTKQALVFADSLKTNLWVHGFRLNSELVKLVWTTRPEIGIRYFSVQRRLANESAWSTVDTVHSRALNGYSFAYTNYTVDDANNYSGLSFYRIVMIDYHGALYYSDVITINGQAAPTRFAIWPNPSTGRFLINIDKLQRVKTVVIWNALGQRVRQVDVLNKELLEMYLFTPGSYLIGFISNDQLISTQRLVVTGW